MGKSAVILGPLMIGFVSLISDTVQHNLYEGGETAYSETLKYALHIFDEEGIKNTQGFDLVSVLQLRQQDNHMVLFL